MKKLLSKIKAFIEKHGIVLILITFFLLVFPNVLDGMIELPRIIYTLMFGSGLLMLCLISLYLIFKKNDIKK